MTDCTVWSGPISNRGYGVKHLPRVNGKRRRVSAHRWTWEQANGPIPEGLCVCHRCDNPPCINLAHLWLGTNLDNIRDRTLKGRSARNRNSGPGEANPRHVLTAGQVEEIRVLHAREGRKLLGRPRIGITRAQIAARFGVAVPTVDAVLSGRNWKGVMP
jgi:hypothetical protein